jgi:hypothetical protein
MTSFCHEFIVSREEKKFLDKQQIVNTHFDKEIYKDLRFITNLSFYIFLEM